MLQQCRKSIIRSQQIFTLIELLVVIAIISVLAGLLLPVLQQAMASAVQITCMTQVRQQHLALTFYLDDYGQNMPYRTSAHMNDMNAVTGRAAWMRYAPDHRSKSIWVCPTYSVNGGLPGGAFTWEAAASLGGGYALKVPVFNPSIPSRWGTGDARATFFYQDQLPAYPGHWSYKSGNRLSLLKKPGEAILINENYRTDTWNMKGLNGGDVRHAAGNIPEGGCNLYADGHLEWSLVMHLFYGVIWHSYR